MNTRNNVQLKIKIKSLAAEARLIRHEENKRKRFIVAMEAKDPAATAHAREEWLSVKAHRRGGVRSEARHSLLAYGFLRGRAYAQLESKCHPGNEPNWDYVEKMLRRFSPGFNGSLQEWYGRP